MGVVEKALKVISLDDEWWGELAGPAAKKPAGFTFLGQSNPVASWRALLVMLCEIMAELHPDNFVTQALTVRGPRRHHIAGAPDDMIIPVPIGATSLWLEANQSSRTAQRVVELTLRAFAYADDDLKLVIQQ